MKKVVILLVCLISLILGFCYFSTSTAKSAFSSSSFLRVHIRANSDDEPDQKIKYEIKDKVVNFLTPFIAQCSTKDEAINCVIQKKAEVIKLINDYLFKNNFDYSCNFKVHNEFFPTRSYDNVVLESGFYDALIIELGNANGANWWCVMYPPLCFSNFNNQNSANIVYKSKILQIIKQFFS